MADHADRMKDVKSKMHSLRLILLTTVIVISHTSAMATQQATIAIAQA
ncbi:hypothetical protein [Bradyrhizobium sp. sBnM-33]|nr:hypothetical protein [Bradyrhizobium sp. sBnM-33]WOH47516.1 hypothetical protein RX328_25405 [Bradyrhizobium sp. sBnM-33]